MLLVLLRVIRQLVVTLPLVLLCSFAMADELRDAADLARESGNPTQAQRQQEQPYNNAPIWRAVRSGQAGTTTFRGNVPETGVLIQSEGETWRRIRNGPITNYGGILLLAVPLAILAFFAIKGQLKLHDQPTGRKIQRFSTWDRIVHWATAISFVILALTGLILLFGKYLLLPLIGHVAFSWLARVSINLHNYIGPFFILCVIAMFVAFVRDNLWKQHDWQWVKKGGGLLTGEHVPSGRFNAGEKAWFWFGVVVLSVMVGATGLILNFGNFGQERLVMQIANVVHGTAAVLYIAAFCGHLYMGTIGVQGSFAAMRDGQVDETWAKEHHEIWYSDAKAGAAPRGAPPADRMQPARLAEE